MIPYGTSRGKIFPHLHTQPRAHHLSSCTVSRHVYRHVRTRPTRHRLIIFPPQPKRHTRHSRLRHTKPNPLGPQGHLSDSCPPETLQPSTATYSRVLQGPPGSSSTQGPLHWAPRVASRQVSQGTPSTSIRCAVHRNYAPGRSTWQSPQGSHTQLCQPGIWRDAYSTARPPDCPKAHKLVHGAPELPQGHRPLSCPFTSCLCPCVPRSQTPFPPASPAAYRINPTPHSLHQAANTWRPAPTHTHHGNPLP